MKTPVKIIIVIIISIAAIVFGLGVRGVYIPPVHIFDIFLFKLFGRALPSCVSKTDVAIIWAVRAPRVFTAFLVGASLAVSGSVMQSVLRNPLASSYTLGVSSGASLGAGLVLVAGTSAPFFGNLALPVFGLAFGLATVFVVISVSGALDRNMANNTIILTGMVFSLFINAIMTLVSALNREQAQKLLFWQMGSFSGKGWTTVFILLPVALFFILFLTRYHNELDIMTFGEDQAKAVGVDIKKVKWLLLASSAALTGFAVAFAGVVGFIDLVAPHIVRRFFGSRHKYVVPISALFGGSFMVVCDVAAQTVTSPSELPVGAVTALIGAPFFVYVYFAGRKKRKL